jgi:hypothetical protein
VYALVRLVDEMCAGEYNRLYYPFYSATFLPLEYFTVEHWCGLRRRKCCNILLFQKIGGVREKKARARKRAKENKVIHRYSQKR